MICKRCGAEISDNEIRCAECGIRVNMNCPVCGSLNHFGAQNCSSCGAALIISCLNCGAHNMYYAENCRKCGMSLVNSHSIQTENKTNLMSESGAPAQIKDEAEKSLEIELDTSSEIGIEPEKKEIEDFNSAQAQSDALPEAHNGLEEDVFEEFQPAAGENAEEKNLNAAADAFKEENLNEIPSAEALEEAVSASETEAEDKEAAEPVSVSEAEKSGAQESPEEEQNIQNKYQHVKINPAAAVKAANILMSPNKHILGIKGPEGCGKTSVLNEVCGIAAEKGYLALMGCCTPLVQITSFGFFQDAFLRLMGFPPYTKSTEAFAKDFTKSSFYNMFSFLESSELTAFLNIFYPSLKDNFDNILQNKMKMFSILEKVIKNFAANNKIIIAADNFELLDGASYEFLLYMIKKGMFSKKIKLAAAYQGGKDMRGYFELANEEEKIFETIELNKCTPQALLQAADNAAGAELEKYIDSGLLNDMIQAADGNASRIEQETAHLFDLGYLERTQEGFAVHPEYRPKSAASSFEELIKARLKNLPSAVKNLLYTAAIMGCRFAGSVLCLAVPMPVEKAQEIIQLLEQNLFLQKADRFTIEFKSLSIWKVIYQEAKNDYNYKDNSNRLYMSLRPLILSNSLQKLISCTAAMNDNEEFLIWQSAANVTAKLGDTNLYVIALKQCLKLIDFQELPDKEAEKLRIYEEMGKLLCEKSPQEAVTYLSNVLDAAVKSSDVNKIIDISSYFAKSCYLSGSNFGAAEAVDAVLNALSKSENGVSMLEAALIKTRKLNALLAAGHCGETVNIAAEEIIPELDRNLKLENITKQLKEIMLDAWFNTKIALAKAYAMQGSPDAALKTADEIYAALNKYKYQHGHIKIKTDLTAAFAKTVSGSINESDKILNNIQQAYENKTLAAEFSAQMHLIDIINRLLSGSLDNIKTDLFNLASDANNINDRLIKNITKLILGYITKLEGNSEKAEEIYSEQIMYFSKEKTAAGALPAWLLIVQKYIEEGSTDKALDTAGKALEIAQDAKINNYLSAVYFQKCMAEIYTEKADFASAKMYLEKAAEEAKQLNLNYALVEIYTAYAQYVQEFMRQQNTVDAEDAGLVRDMYEKALALADRLGIKNKTEQITQEFDSFKTYCKLNSVDI